MINNNDIRYSLAVDDAQAKKDGRYKKGTNYHGLGATAVKEIYEKLSNPIAVIAADKIYFTKSNCFCRFIYKR